jgi:uncharacterized protein
MIISNDAKIVSLRLGPGEDLLAGLAGILDAQGADGGALVAAAGSLEHLAYSVVRMEPDNVPRYTRIIEEIGAIEITGLQGHLGREVDGSATTHLHGTFALEDGSVRAGHVFAARVLVTVELTVILTPDLAWHRSSVQYGAGNQMPVLLPSHRPLALHSSQAAS